MNEYKEPKFDGKLFLKYIRKRLVFIVVIAALFTCYFTYSNTINLYNDYKSAKSSGKYEVDREAFENQKANYDANIKRIEAKISQYNAYAGSSLLMQLDPYNVNKAMITYSITQLPEEVNAGGYSISHIMAYYQNEFNGSAPYSYVAEKLGGTIDVKFLREIISLSWLDYDHSYITVSIMSGDPEQLQAIRGAIEEYMVSCADTLRQMGARFTLTEIIGSDQSISGTCVDTSILDRQNAVTNYISTLNTSVTNERNNLNALVVPDDGSAAKSKLTITFIKAVLFSFILVSLICVLILYAIYLWSDTVKGERELSESFGLKSAGRIKTKKKGSTVTMPERIIKNIMTRERSLAKQDSAADSDKKNILFVSFDKEPGTLNLPESYGHKISVISGIDMDENDEALERLSESDDIVVPIVTLEKTKRADLEKVLDLIAETGKEPAFAIAVERS